jgi:phosphoglucosamine mutase
LKAKFPRDFDLTGYRIVYDGANGAGYECGVNLLEELGADVIPMACPPNGFNINKGCSQEDTRLLGQRVVEAKADIGIGVDGDADRLVVCDEKGQQISGEHLMFEIATFLKVSNRLAENKLVTTTMANQALEKALRDFGIECLRCQVGDRYVTQTLKEHKAIFGGETSGHFIFLDQNTTADGLFSGLEVLALLRHRKCKASELQHSFKLFPQKLVSLPVKEKKPIEQVPQLHGAIQELEKRYQGQGRVNVRYSGTQAMIRLMVEGPDENEVENDVGSLAKIVEKELG